MKKLLLLFLITTYSAIFAQTFQKRIGGGIEDGAYAIQQTTDGGYVLAGYTRNFGGGNYNMYIVKFDVNGALQWNKAVAATGVTLARSIVQTTDGYVVAGETDSYGAGSYDTYIVKFDTSGAVQWSKTIGGTGADYGTSIIQTTDGGYAVAGRTNSYGAGNFDMYVIKLDTGGTVQWSRTIGGTGADAANSIIQTTDGYVIAGYTSSYGAGNSDMYIVKLDASGTLLWSKTIGGTGFDGASSIIQTTDGYVMAGYTPSFGAGSNDIYVVKLDASGTFYWTRTVGTTNFESARSIIQTTEGGYAVGGWTNQNTYIVKLDSAGSLQWSKTISGASGDNGHGFIIQTIDGGYALAGTGTNYDIYIVKLDASWNTCGNIQTATSTAGTGGTITTPTSTVTSPTPTITFPAPTVITGGTVTTICTTVGVNQEESEIPRGFRLEQNYPNPFNPSTTITYHLPTQALTTLRVYDLLGREVATLVNEVKALGSYEITWNAEGVASGVYIYRLNAGGLMLSKRLMVLR